MANLNTSHTQIRCELMTDVLERLAAVIGRCETSEDLVEVEVSLLVAARAELAKSPWVRVQELTSGGCNEVENPRYPDPGQIVIIEIETGMGARKRLSYEIGGLHKDAGKRQGYWSWPSFGVRWAPLPTESSQ